MENPHGNRLGKQLELYHPRPHRYESNRSGNSLKQWLPELPSASSWVIAAATLNVEDTSLGNRNPSLQGATHTLWANPANITVRSLEFRNAIKSLNASPSDDDILQLANSIRDKSERAQFFLIAVRALQGKPTSITYMADAILKATGGSEDPELSLAVPRIVLSAADRTDNSPIAQLALTSFVQEATLMCAGDFEEGDIGYRKADGCISEYNRVATEVAKSPMKGTLHISDPSLLQRVEMNDLQNCDSLTHEGASSK